MKRTDIETALLTLRPASIWSLLWNTDSTYVITWADATQTQPTNEELMAQIASQG